MSIIKKNANFWLKLKNRKGLRFRVKPAYRTGRPGMTVMGTGFPIGSGMTDGGAWAPKKARTTAMPILALAPMAGITDSAFRQVCKKYGADVVYTEMISADGLFYDAKKTLAMLDFHKSEQPAVIQLFGKEPSKFTKAAQLAEQAGFAGIDINFGCPAKKVAGRGGGVTMMRDLNKCRQIIEATLAGTSLPVSIKLRTSIKKSADPSQAQDDKAGVVTSLDFLKAMKGLPLAAVMIHGRPYENPFQAEIDYEMIKYCVQYLKVEFPDTVVLGNGGINTPADAKKMLELTGVDGLGLARGLYGKPWLFDQIKKYLKTGKVPEYPPKKIKQVILDHAKFALKSKDTYGLVELRKHLLWYVSGWPNARELRSRLVKVENIKQIKEALK